MPLSVWQDRGAYVPSSGPLSFAAWRLCCATGAGRTVADLEEIRELIVAHPRESRRGSRSGCARHGVGGKPMVRCGTWWRGG